VILSCNVVNAVSVTLFVSQVVSLCMAPPKWFVRILLWFLACNFVVY